MNPKATPIDRSNLLITAFQIDGLCTALRHSVRCGLPPGPATLSTLASLHREFAAIHCGPSLEVLPKIDASSTPSDVLTFAEALRATVAAFLSPDEITDKHRAISFYSAA